MTNYTLSRFTPAGILQVATGTVYADLVKLAETAAKGEQPNCGWQVRNDGDDKILAAFYAKGSVRDGKLEVV